VLQWKKQLVKYPYKNGWKCLGVAELWDDSDWNRNILEMQLVDQQSSSMVDHVQRLGITQRLSVQSGQVVSPARIFPLHSRYVGLAHDLASIRNKLRVDFLAICDIEEATPLFNYGP